MAKTSKGIKAFKPTARKAKRTVQKAKPAFPKTGEKIVQTIKSISAPVNHSPRRLRQRIAYVIKNTKMLTPKERFVLFQRLNGSTSSKIAEGMNITTSGAQNFENVGLRKILRKWGNKTN